MKRQAIIAFLVFGCSAATTSAPTDGLQIVRNSTTEFDAMYSSGDEWARVEVKYSPSTTFFRVTTSFNTTLVYQGTAQGDPNFILDPRMDASDGFVTLAQDDKEFHIVQLMLNALMERGVTSIPTIEQKATTLYAGGYSLAQTLGFISMADPANSGLGGQDGYRTVWPSPGYDDPSMLPPELRADQGAQSFLNGDCCGPKNCNHCDDYNNGWPCNDWCAAGDHCNAYHSSRGCGTICQIGACGVSCPHANSNYICGSGGSQPAKTFCAHHIACGC